MIKYLKYPFIAVMIFAACQFNSHNFVLADSVSSVSQDQVISTEDTSKVMAQGTSNSPTAKSTSQTSIVNSDDLNNVPLNKVWEVKFSQPVGLEAAKNSVKIIEKNTNKELPISITLSQNDCCINIAPLSKYNPSSEYILSIDANLISKYNKKLKNSVSVTFKTEALTITGIDDINVSINKGDSYKLPDQVAASMSDGSKKQVSVTWDKAFDLSLEAGTYTYQGSVSGYHNKVNLKLTINSLAPPDITKSKTDATFAWIWQLQNQVDTYGGIDNFISKLKSLGISNVCIKYHEGSSPSGGGVNFKNDFLKYIKNFKDAGFTVGTWGYNYFNYPQAEADLIIDALNNSDYYIFDPEDDVAGKTDQAEQVCQLVRSEKSDAVIGYASYPIATLHEDIPYSVFNKYCDFAAPQCYWGEMQWSMKGAVDGMINSYKELGLDKPIYPVIQTYNVSYYDLIDYLNYNFDCTGLWAVDDWDSTFTDFQSNRGSGFNKGSWMYKRPQ